MVYLGEGVAIATLEVMVHLPRPALLAGASAPVGSDWAASGASLAPRVPGAVAPVEHNILPNPDHPDFGRLQIGQAMPFLFNQRLSQS